MNKYNKGRFAGAVSQPFKFDYPNAGYAKHSVENNTCGDCCGSGWATQFIKVCPTCKGTGKKIKEKE